MPPPGVVPGFAPPPPNPLSGFLDGLGGIGSGLQGIGEGIGGVLNPWGAALGAAAEALGGGPSSASTGPVNSQSGPATSGPITISGTSLDSSLSYAALQGNPYRQGGLFGSRYGAIAQVLGDGQPIGSAPGYAAVGPGAVPGAVTAQGAAVAAMDPTDPAKLLGYGAFALIGIGAIVFLMKGLKS